MFSNQRYLEKLKQKKVYIDFFSKTNISTYQYSTPRDFFDHFWNDFLDYVKKYQKETGKTLNNSNFGSAFEIIIGFLLNYEEIQITSMDESIDGVFEVKPDFIVSNDKNKHIFISLKTSFRERWKQADWECIHFKKKYPDSLCFVLCNHEREIKTVKKKLYGLCIDQMFYTGSEEICTFIKEIKK